MWSLVIYYYFRNQVVLSLICMEKIESLKILYITNSQVKKSRLGTKSCTLYFEEQGRKASLEGCFFPSAGTRSLCSGV